MAQIIPVVIKGCRWLWETKEEAVERAIRDREIFIELFVKVRIIKGL